MLYPLSYEGGDGAERGAKLGATAPKFLESGSFGASAWTFAGVEQAGLPGER